MMKRRHWPTTPLILGIILGPMLEQSLRQSLELSGGTPVILLTRPISVTLIILTAVLLVFIRRVLYKPEFREGT
jgi:putative tricarboxylic transport membrane protein